MQKIKHKGFYMRWKWAI